MRLMRSTAAVECYFAIGSMDIRTLNAAIERGDVPGQVWRNGGRPSYFVDIDRFVGQAHDHESASVDHRQLDRTLRREMRLIRSTEALARYFEPSSMDIRTLNAAIGSGNVPGQVWNRGRRPQYWVDVAQFEQRTGNELVDRVLRRLATEQST